jgi:hypothetical protein
MSSRGKRKKKKKNIASLLATLVRGLRAREMENCLPRRTVRQHQEFKKPLACVI